VAITFDGVTKLATLSAGTTALSVVDLWSRWEDWVATGDNSKYLPMFVSVGGNTIDAGAGTSVPLYCFLVNGWRVKPQEANHSLSVTGGVLLVDGGGDPFVNTTGVYNVRISYSQPVQAITVATGGGGGTTAADVWAYANRSLTSSLDPTAVDVALAMRTELAAELAMLDAAISTRLATLGYTAPPAASAVAAEVLSAAQAAPIHADTKKMNGAAVTGTGTSVDKWRGV
jgi:hypothetical protein